MCNKGLYVIICKENVTGDEDILQQTTNCYRYIEENRIETDKRIKNIFYRIFYGYYIRTGITFEQHTLH